MVPGSTLRYGSNFIRLTLSPRLSSRQPIDAAASPLPREDTTPPVTKTYFAAMNSSPLIVGSFLGIQLPGSRMACALGQEARWGAQPIMAESEPEGNRLLVWKSETKSAFRLSSE